MIWSQAQFRRGQRKMARTCQVCSGAFSVYIAHVRNGAAGMFCSRECQVNGRKKRTKTMIQKKCKECDKAFEIRKGYGGTGTYCSTACRAVGSGRILQGKNHPNWKGGISERPSKSRSAIKDRLRLITSCERCGSASDLQGHHIRHYSTHPELMNDASNIEILCSCCHANEHPHLRAMIMRPIQRTGSNLSCQVCDSEFYVKPFRKNKARFCSDKCQLLFLHVLRHQHSIAA